MRRCFVVVTFALISLAGWGQSHKYQINAETPEGQLLQKAGQEADDAKKTAVYEEYLTKHPKHDGVIYAWNQVQPLFLKAKNYEKVIEGGRAILAAEPTNSPAGYNALQAAEAKNDVAGVIEWSNLTVDAARKAMAAPKPADEDEVAAWDARVDFSKQVIARCEYSFYASSLRIQDPAGIAALFEALEKMNGQSQYVAMAAPRYFIALLQQKDMAKAQAFAERAAAANQASDDMLLFAADANLTGTKDYDKAIAYAAKITDTLPAKAAPEGVAAADWEAKKKATLGRAHWIAGTAWGVKANWPNTEKSMKAAIPLVEGTAAAKDLLPGAYFYLGLANHSQARASGKVDATRIAEAKRNFTLCSKLPSPFQAQAQKNLAAIAAGK